MELKHKFLSFTYRDTGAPCILREDRIRSERLAEDGRGGMVIEYSDGKNYVVKEEMCGISQNNKRRTVRGLIR